MATAPIVWADSFQHYASADAASIYPGGEFHTSATIDNGGGRGSPARGSAKFGYSSAGGWGRIEGSSYTCWIFNFAIKVDTGGQDFQLYMGGSGTSLVVQLDNSGYSTPSGLQAPLAGKWVHISIRTYRNSSAGTLDIWHDESLVYTASGLNTGSATNQWRIGTNANAISDLIIQASNTATDTPVGDRAVLWVPQTGDGGDGDWTPSTGTDHFAMVDDTNPDGDTTYISADTADDADTFTHDDLPASVAGVDAVVWKAWVKKTDAGTRTVAPVLRISSTDYEGDEQSLGTNYVQLAQVYETNPATDAAWTPTEVNALESGVKVKS